MAMAWIWTGMAVVSVVCGAVYGRMEAVSAAALEGAGQAVRLCLSMAGVLCLWMGGMEIMRRSGLLPPAYHTRQNASNVCTLSGMS